MSTTQGQYVTQQGHQIIINIADWRCDEFKQRPGLKCHVYHDRGFGSQHGLCADAKEAPLLSPADFLSDI